MKTSIFSIEYIELFNKLKLDKTFRVQQILDFIIKNKIFDFQKFSSIPKGQRDFLSENFYILDVKVFEKFESKDGTIKFLFELNDKNFIEDVYLKDKNNRITFCISSQSGCRMGCTFCKTGKMNLLRSLNFTEIISQILYLSYIMANDETVVDTAYNIVFMGMGEPFDNFDNIKIAINILTDKKYFGLSENRITVSTCGLIDKIPLLLEKFPDIKLAVSLTSSNQHKREQLMPVTKSNPLDKLLEVLLDVYSKYKNRITLEYVLLKDFNMRHEDIKDLRLFKNRAFHLNLIPLNSDDNNFKRPDEKEIKYFMGELEKEGFCVTRRYRRGEDIQADCGQLYWTVSQSNH